MRVLITGVAGFIGFHLALRLLQSNIEVIGVDNLNSYYDLKLKIARLHELGIADESIIDRQASLIPSKKFSSFSFLKINLAEAGTVEKLFSNNTFDIICHLAAQPGVRYSITHPEAYMESNVQAFFNVLQYAATIHKPKLFLYASSSSVYGNSDTTPFAVHQRTDQPISFYAATKKTNELFAYTYSHIYNLKTIGLRFFTVYGPWGRPDMAYFSFTKKILANETIPLFNNGQLRRDFTYIDDITKAISSIVLNEGKNTKSNYQLYNISNHECVELLRFVNAIENSLNKKANIQYLPMQPGDVETTFADISDLQRDYDYHPSTSIEDGIKLFVDWYKNYYKI